MTKTSQQQKKQTETQAAAGKGSVQFETLSGKNADDGTKKKKKKKQPSAAAVVAKPAIDKKTKKKKKEKKALQQAANNTQQTVKAVSVNDGDAVSVPNTTVPIAAATDAAVAPKRKRRFKPGTVAKRQIRKYQNGNTKDGTGLLLRKTPYRRLCQEIMADFVSDRRFTHEATLALQVAGEAVAVEYMANMAISARLTQHETVGLRHSHHVRGVIMPFIGTPQIRDAATGQRTFGDAASYSSNATTSVLPNKKHRRKSGMPKRVVVAAPDTVASSEPPPPPPPVDEAPLAVGKDDDDDDDSDATDSSSATEGASVATQLQAVDEAIVAASATNGEATEPASTAD